MGGAAILQTAVISRLPLLIGTADLGMLVIVAWTIQPFVKRAWIWVILGGLFSMLSSSMTTGVIPLAYLLIYGMAIFLRQRFWKARLLTMLALSVVGTVIVHSMSVAAIAFSGTFLSISDVINLVTLPSILLNLVFALPVYAFAREIVRWLYPEKIEV